MASLQYYSRIFSGVIACIVAFSHSAVADNGYLPVSARAAATSESVLASVDDATAVYWNPAGLTAVRKNELSTMWADLYGVGGLDNTYLAFAKPLSSKVGVGIDWMYTGFSDAEFFYHQNRYAVGLGYQLHPRVALGLTGKVLSTDAGLRDLQSPANFSGKGSAIGYDIGVLLSPISGLTWGFVAQDIGGTKLKYGNGVERSFRRPSLRFGAAWSTNTKLVLGFAIDHTARLGAEYQLHPMLTLRAGAQRDRSVGASDELGYAFGTGIKIRELHIDYAYSSLPDLETSHRISMNFSFHLSKGAIRIEGFSVDNLLPAFSHRYQSEPIGKITLTNTSDEPVEASLRLMIPEIMAQPMQITHKLGPASKSDIPFSGQFSNGFKHVDVQHNVEAKVEVTYSNGGQHFSAVETTELVVFPNRSLRWRDVGVAAAFVDTTDETVLRLMAQPAEWSNGLSTVDRAAILFKALEDQGVRYRPDPDFRYSEAMRSTDKVDYIKGPREVISAGFGDVDDLTVFYASMLESAGISTALIAAPGRLFLAISTDGLTDVQKDGCIEHDNALWLPIDMRLLGTSFEEAHSAASAELEYLKNTASFDIATTAESWEMYPPTSQVSR